MNQADGDIKVLVVEDKEPEYDKLCRWLGLRQHEVRQFNPDPLAQGRQAQGQSDRIRKVLEAELTRYRKLRVVILDLVLRDVDVNKPAVDFTGQSLCRYLHDNHENLSLVLVTMAPAFQDLYGFRRWGAAHAWVKPWAGGKPVPDPDEEAKQIRKLIDEDEPTAGP